MRGKRPCRGRGRVGRRIIPAHAGQTHTWRRMTLAPADHPRACGANGETLHVKCGLNGSSPRMRGKRFVARHRVKVHRIIPAHAGQTRPQPPRHPVSTDHPRACGANPTLRRAEGAHVGSSPRMRGKRGLCGVRRLGCRIIPAHAGQTQTPHTLQRPPPDHPRACGANLTKSRNWSLASGSSPRMRGKRPEHRGPNGRGRIIPAHAGQTPCSPTARTPATDHPRACGANYCLSLGTFHKSGSSPRMRGKLNAPCVYQRAARIIPAHAGQTWSVRAAVRVRPDHPRACGANSPILCENS